MEAYKPTNKMCKSPLKAIGFSDCETIYISKILIFTSHLEKKAFKI